MSGHIPFADFKFIELAHWPLKQKWPNRNRILTIDGFISHYDNLKLGSSTALFNEYRGINRFDIGFRDYVHKNGSVERYEGEHILDAAIIESDGKTFPEASKFLFNELLPKLYAQGLDQKELLVDPSGNKGFHIEIPAGIFKPTPHPRLFKIHELFIRALTEFPETYYGQGQKVDTATYQICRLLRLRGTKNLQKDGLEEPHRGFKINLNGSLESLRDNPELVYDLWKIPNQEALGYDYLSGQWHWQQKPNQRLQDLWQECQSRVDDQQKKRVFVPDSQKHPTKRRIRVGEVPACLKALEDMALSSPEKVKEQNLRNYITCAITTFYAEAGYSDAWVEAHVLGLMNNCIAPDFTREEVIQTVRTKLAGDNGGAKYSFGCGRESGFPSCLHKFCSDSGELKDCPAYKAKEEKKSTNLVSIYDAGQKAIDNYDRGPSPYVFSNIPDLANFYGPFWPGNKFFMQAVQTVGKSRLLFGFLDVFAPIAKTQGDIILAIFPEEQPEESAEKWQIRQCEKTLEQLYTGGSKSVPQEVRNWLESYRDTIYLWNVVDQTVKEMENAVEQAQQVTGKKVAILSYDGITFFRDNNQFRKTEANIAQELIHVQKKFPYARSIYSVHMPKEVGKEARKEGRLETEHRGGIMAAYGSVLYSASAQLLLSLWEQDGFVMVGCEKAKVRWKGDIKKLEPICLVPDRFFRLHTLEAALALVDQGNQAWFEVDVRSVYQLREQRKRMKKNNFKISEME